MKKIFILEASQGSYDEYHKFIIGVYDNKENAEIQKKIWQEKLSEIINKYSYEEKTKLNKEFIEYSSSDEYYTNYENYLETLPEHLKEFEKYPFKYNSDMINLNSLIITEYILNKTEFNLNNLL